MSDNVSNRLKGDGVSKYGYLEDLPKFKFDFQDWGSELKPEVSIQLAFQEGKTKEGVEPKYSYTHNKKHFGSGKGSIIQSIKQSTHIEISIPSGKIEKLIDAQSSHLQEITGQTPKYKKEKTKVIIKGQETEAYDVNLVIPEKQLKEFVGKKDTGIGNGYYEVKYNKNETDFLIVGEKIEFAATTGNVIDTLEWASLSSNQNRTKLMFTENVVEKDGKFYKLFQANKATEDSGTTVREANRRVLIINYDENDPNSPYSFVKTHTKTFIQMHKTYFDDPLTVNTLIVKANIKTEKGTAQTFAEQVTATHKKKPTEEQKEEGEEPDRYETLKYVLIGKRKYSPALFDKLKQKAKKLEKVVSDLNSKIAAGPPRNTRRTSDWKEELQINSDKETKELTKLNKKIKSANHIWEKLSPAGIKRLSDNAFSQKEPTLGKDGKKSYKTISEADYRALPKEEQSQYKSAVNVIATQSGSSSVNVEPMTSYGKDTLKVGQVTAQTLPAKFRNATIECEFFIQTHGRFNMNPVQGGGANYKLSNFVDETKVYISDLLELVELTPSELIAEIGA